MFKRFSIFVIFFTLFIKLQIKLTEYKNKIIFFLNHFQIKKIFLTYDVGMNSSIQIFVSCDICIPIMRYYEENCSSPSAEGNLVNK